MEKRFTVKDFIFLASIAALFILMLISMYMVDRQWSKLAEMERSLSEQAQDMRALRGAIRAIGDRVEGGAAISPQATESGGRFPASKEGHRGKLAGAFQRAYDVSQRVDYAEGDWLVRGLSTGLKTLTPLVSTDGYSSSIQSYVLESLMDRDPETLEWQGHIAKSWSVSQDGLTFIFNLRDDVTFSDGRPLDASDVAFSFDFLMNEKIAAPRDRAYYRKIKSVKATGKYQVVFKFKEPYFNSMALAGGLDIMPKHFYARYLKNPEKFNQSKGLLLGSGPYRLKDPRSWRPDQNLVELVRNPRYWGDVQPSFDRMLWKIIASDSAQLTTFRNREVDLYVARPIEYKKLLNDKKLSSRTLHYEYTNPLGGYGYIGWNQIKNGKPTPFADKRVRQAMTYMTDRESIIKQIFLGYGKVTVGPFSPASKQHDPNLKPRPYNLAKAKALLSEAGFADRNNDGVLEDAKGKPFEFELVYFQDNEDTKRMVIYLRDMYKLAGIVLKPKPTEWAVMLETMDKRNFDAITLAWGGVIESDPYQIFHSSQIKAGADNYVSYKSEKLDKLIDQARSTVDEDKRMPLWRLAERQLYEDQPYTFVLRRKSLVFVDKRFHNLKVTRMGLNHKFVPLEIYTPLKSQLYAQ